MNLNFLLEIDRNHFKEIANELMNYYCITKNDSRDNSEIIYRFAEIEFYLYDSNQPEIDVATYNRNCTCIEWFFHKSGVDITFVTKCKNNELEQFGGILIRSIEIYKRDVTQKRWKQIGFIGGPQLSMFEIFNHCSSMPDIITLPNTFNKSRKIRITSRIGIKDNAPQRFVFDDINWNIKTERIIERKSKDGKYHVLLEKSTKKYNPSFEYDYGLSM